MVSARHDIRFLKIDIYMYILSTSLLLSITSLIIIVAIWFNCMVYREYGKWIHKSPSDQCKVILGLAVSNNGVALDNM